MRSSIGIGTSSRVADRRETLETRGLGIKKGPSGYRFGEFDPPMHHAGRVWVRTITTAVVRV